MSSSTSIDTFVSHFQRVLGRLGDLSNDPVLVMLKKLGLAAAIDGMSNVSPHRDLKSGPRFIAFIRHFSGWSDSERISLPHLEHALSKDTRPEFEQMKRYVSGLLANWPSANPGPLDITHDPMPAELLALWPKEGDSFKKLAEVKNEHFSHVYLLYCSRNSLAHELREGSWHTIEGDVTYPHYTYTKINKHREEVASHRERWLLYYPAEFFETLATNCLKKLEEWLREEHVDPYEHRRFGDFFLKEPN